MHYSHELELGRRQLETVACGFVYKDAVDPCGTAGLTGGLNQAS